MGSWNPICSQKFLTGHNGAFLDEPSTFCQIQGKQRDGLLCINNTCCIIMFFLKLYIYVTLSHLRSKESTGIRKPYIPAFVTFQGYM